MRYVEYAVRTTGLVKRFGKFTAIDGLDLRVRKGEVYGLLGPNGAGKTTTIKALVGLLRTNGGDSYLLGTKLPSKRIMARVGYMPQEIALYNNLSVHENLAFFGRIYGLDRKTIRSREEELLEFVDLVKWRKKLVGKLSGGMMHRASLACALIPDPELLFLDEPTVGVDPKLRESFWRFFARLKRQGKTMVITTHYMDEARHCNRIGFMREGKLIAEGTPEEILRKTGVESLEDSFLLISNGEVVV